MIPPKPSGPPNSEYRDRAHEVVLTVLMSLSAGCVAGVVYWVLAHLT